MPPPPPSEVQMPGAAAAVHGAPPAAATPTITIVSGNQLRVQPATWTSGGSSGSGGGGPIAGRQSPSIEAGPYAGADGVAPSLPPPQLLPVAAPSPFQAPGAGFGEDPLGEAAPLQRRPSYGTQVRSPVPVWLHSRLLHVNIAPQVSLRNKPSVVNQSWGIMQ